MSDPEAAYLVNANSDPIHLVVIGHACFRNASPIQEFFDSLIRQGKHHFVVDLESCTGMDSTFLGILAGAGIKLHGVKDGGELILIHLNEHNREAVESLGLDQIININSEDEIERNWKELDTLDHDKVPTEDERLKLTLDAHENLVKANKENWGKFQDVIQFLRDRSDG